MPPSCSGRSCANDVDVPPAGLVYTQWLNDRGGIEADLTVCRLAETQFLVVTPATSQTRDFHWLRRHDRATSRHAHRRDSAGIAVLGVMGPNAEPC